MPQPPDTLPEPKRGPRCVGWAPGTSDRDDPRFARSFTDRGLSRSPGALPRLENAEGIGVVFKNRTKACRGEASIDGCGDQFDQLAE